MIDLTHWRRKTVNANKSYTSLMRKPNFQYHYTIHVFHVSDEAFDYLFEMEKVYRVIHPLLCGQKSFNLSKTITNYMSQSIECNIPNCNSLRKKSLIFD